MSESEQAQRTQLRGHSSRHRRPLRLILRAGTPVRRRVNWQQIAPALKWPPWPPEGRDQLRHNLDQAIGAALVVVLAAETDDALAGADLTANHPVKRAAA